MFAKEKLPSLFAYAASHNWSQCSVLELVCWDSAQPWHITEIDTFVCIAIYEHNNNNN